MDKPGRLRAAVDVIGIIAVVGSLVFVGFEIRENTKATRSETQQAMASTASDAAAAVLDNTALLDLLVDVEADTTRLQDLDGTREGLMLDYFYVWTFNFMENAYFHFLNGTLAPEIWEAHRRAHLGQATSPVFRHHWEKLRPEYFEEFQALMDETVASAAGS